MMIVVLARDFGDFRDWCSKNNIHPLNKHLVFLNHDSKVRAVRDPLILRLPRYRENPLWDSPNFGDILSSRAWSGPLLELTETMAVDLLEFMAKYTWHNLTYETVEAFIKSYQEEDANADKTTGIPEVNP